MSGNLPTTKRQHETKEALLKAGAECFAKKGYHASGVREICEKAKANPAAVNYHFGGKQEFYRAVLLNEFESASPPPPDLLERAETPELQFRAFVFWFVDRMIRNQGNNVLRDILNHELREPTGALQLLIDHSMRPISTRLDRIITDLLGRQADPRTVQLCAISVFGQCLIYKTERPIIEHMYGKVLFDKEGMDTIAEHIFRLTLAGIRSYLPDGKEAE